MKRKKLHKEKWLPVSHFLNAYLFKLNINLSMQIPGSRGNVNQSSLVINTSIFSHHFKSSKFLRSGMINKIIFDIFHLNKRMNYVFNGWFWILNDGVSIIPYLWLRTFLLFTLYFLLYTFYFIIYNYFILAHG